MTSGVSQASILGPILFIIFISSISLIVYPAHVKYLQMILNCIIFFQS